MSDLSATDVLKRGAVVGLWVRARWKLLSWIAGVTVSVLGALASAALWVLHQTWDVEELQKRDPTDQLNRIEAKQTEILTQLAGVKSDLTNIEGRVGRQEAQWDRVTELAEAPPHRRPRSRVIQ